MFSSEPAMGMSASAQRTSDLLTAVQTSSERSVYGCRSGLLHLREDARGTSCCCHDVCEAFEWTGAFSVWRRRFSVV